MVKFNSNSTCDRTVQDKAYDLLGELLIERQTKKILQELEEEKARGDTAEMDTFFAKQDQNNLAKIQAYSRKQRTKRFFLHKLPKIGQIAAIVVAVVALAGGVAVATSHTVRVHVMQMLINIEEQYTEIKLVEDETAAFDVPAQWEGSSYLSYIPDGLELLGISTGNNINLAEYAVAQTREICLRFQESNEAVEMNVDTEKAKMEKITVCSNEGYIVKKDETIQVFWSDENHFFLLTTKGMEQTETLEIANSMIRMPKAD